MNSTLTLGEITLHVYQNSLSINKEITHNYLREVLPTSFFFWHRDLYGSQVKDQTQWMSFSKVSNFSLLVFSYLYWHDSHFKTTLSENHLLSQHLPWCLLLKLQQQTYLDSLSLCICIWAFLTLPDLTMLVGFRICWLYLLYISKETPKRDVLGMTLNCIWLYSSSSKDLGSVEYFFIVITPSFTLTESGNIC